MKIGIVTITDYKNFGNRLQNYAVYYILKKRFGCEAESLVVYQYEHGYERFLLPIEQTLALLVSIFPIQAKNIAWQKACRYGAFRRWSRLIPARHFCNCAYIPNSVSDDYDYFFAGSDQIWNYHIMANGFRNVFLEFTEAKKRVALSASFGLEEIPEELKSIYQKGLKGFSHISVREYAGAKIVKNLIGQDVPVLVDPVMMLDVLEWLKVSKKPRFDCSAPFVLKYFLGDKIESDRIDAWAQENGFLIYDLRNNSIPDLFTIGPGEFVYLIHKASLVLSDSFHGILLSILFSRPFVVFARQEKTMFTSQMTSRMDTLLRKFHFEDRWEYCLSEKDYLSCDFSHVEDLLEKERKLFLAYVSSILGDKK